MNINRPPVMMNKSGGVVIGTSGGSYNKPLPPPPAPAGLIASPRPNPTSTSFVATTYQHQHSTASHLREKNERSAALQRLAFLLGPILRFQLFRERRKRHRLMNRGGGGGGDQQQQQPPSSTTAAPSNNNSNPTTTKRYKLGEIVEYIKSCRRSFLSRWPHEVLGELLKRAHIRFCHDGEVILYEGEPWWCSGVIVALSGDVTVLPQRETTAATTTTTTTVFGGNNTASNTQTNNINSNKRLTAPLIMGDDIVLIHGEVRQAVIAVGFVDCVLINAQWLTTFLFGFKGIRYEPIPSTALLLLGRGRNPSGTTTSHAADSYQAKRRQLIRERREAAKERSRRVAEEEEEGLVGGEGGGDGNGRANNNTPISNIALPRYLSAVDHKETIKEIAPLRLGLLTRQYPLTAPLLMRSWLLQCWFVSLTEVLEDAVRRCDAFSGVLSALAARQREEDEREWERERQTRRENEEKGLTAQQHQQTGMVNSGVGALPTSVASFPKVANATATPSTTAPMTSTTTTATSNLLISSRPLPGSLATNSILAKLTAKVSALSGGGIIGGSSHATPNTTANTSSVAGGGGGGNGPNKIGGSSPNKALAAVAATSPSSPIATSNTPNKNADMNTLQPLPPFLEKTKALLSLLAMIQKGEGGDGLLSQLLPTAEPQCFYAGDVIVSASEGGGGAQQPANSIYFIRRGAVRVTVKTFGACVFDHVRQLKADGRGDVVGGGGGVSSSYLGYGTLNPMFQTPPSILEGSSATAASSPTKKASGGGSTSIVSSSSPHRFLFGASSMRQNSGSGYADDHTSSVPTTESYILHSGAVFGEWDCIFDLPGNATVVALSTVCDVWRVRQHSLQEWFGEAPSPALAKALSAGAVRAMETYLSANANTTAAASSSTSSPSPSSRQQHHQRVVSVTEEGSSAAHHRPFNDSLGSLVLPTPPDYSSATAPPSITSLHAPSSASTPMTKDGSSAPLANNAVGTEEEGAAFAHSVLRSAGVRPNTAAAHVGNALKSSSSSPPPLINDLFPTAEHVESWVQGVRRVVVSTATLRREMWWLHMLTSTPLSSTTSHQGLNNSNNTNATHQPPNRNASLSSLSSSSLTLFGLLFSALRRVPALGQVSDAALRSVISASSLPSCTAASNASSSSLSSPSSSSSVSCAYPAVFLPSASLTNSPLLNAASPSLSSNSNTNMNSNASSSLSSPCDAFIILLRGTVRSQSALPVDGAPEVSAPGAVLGDACLCPHRWYHQWQAVTLVEAWVVPARAIVEHVIAVQGAYGKTTSIIQHAETVSSRILREVEQRNSPPPTTSSPEQQHSPRAASSSLIHRIHNIDEADDGETVYAHSGGSINSEPRAYVTLAMELLRQQQQRGVVGGGGGGAAQGLMGVARVLPSTTIVESGGHGVVGVGKGAVVGVLPNNTTGRSGSSGGNSASASGITPSPPNSASVTNSNTNASSSPSAAARNVHHGIGGSTLLSLDLGAPSSWEREKERNKEVVSSPNTQSSNSYYQHDHPLLRSSSNRRASLQAFSQSTAFILNHRPMSSQGPKGMSSPSPILAAGMGMGMGSSTRKANNGTAASSATATTRYPMLFGPPLSMSLVASDYQRSTTVGAGAASASVVGSNAAEESASGGSSSSVVDRIAFVVATRESLPFRRVNDAGSACTVEADEDYYDAEGEAAMLLLSHDADEDEDNDGDEDDCADYEGRGRGSPRQSEARRAGDGGGSSACGEGGGGCGGAFNEQFFARDVFGATKSKRHLASIVPAWLKRSIGDAVAPIPSLYRARYYATLSMTPPSSSVLNVFPPRLSNSGSGVVGVVASSSSSSPSPPRGAPQLNNIVMTNANANPNINTNISKGSSSFNSNSGASLLARVPVKPPLAPRAGVVVPNTAGPTVGAGRGSGIGGGILGTDPLTLVPRSPSDQRSSITYQRNLQQQQQQNGDSGIVAGTPLSGQQRTRQDFSGAAKTSSSTTNASSGSSLGRSGSSEATHNHFNDNDQSQQSHALPTTANNRPATTGTSMPSSATIASMIVVDTTAPQATTAFGGASILDDADDGDHTHDAYGGADDNDDGTGSSHTQKPPRGGSYGSSTRASISPSAELSLNAVVTLASEGTAVFRSDEFGASYDHPLHQTQQQEHQSGGDEAQQQRRASDSTLAPSPPSSVCPQRSHADTEQQQDDLNNTANSVSSGVMIEAALVRKDTSSPKEMQIQLRARGSAEVVAEEKEERAEGQKASIQEQPTTAGSKNAGPPPLPPPPPPSSSASPPLPPIPQQQKKKGRANSIAVGCVEDEGVRLVNIKQRSITTADRSGLARLGSAGAPRSLLLSRSSRLGSAQYTRGEHTPLLEKLEEDGFSASAASMGRAAIRIGSIVAMSAEDVTAFNTAKALAGLTNDMIDPSLVALAGLNGGGGGITTMDAEGVFEGLGKAGGEAFINIGRGNRIGSAFPASRGGGGADGKGPTNRRISVSFVNGGDEAAKTATSIEQASFSPLGGGRVGGGNASSSNTSKTSGGGEDNGDDSSPSTKGRGNNSNANANNNGGSMVVPSLASGRDKRLADPGVMNAPHHNERVMNYFTSANNDDNDGVAVAAGQAAQSLTVGGGGSKGKNNKKISVEAAGLDENPSYDYEDEPNYETGGSGGGKGATPRPNSSSQKEAVGGHLSSHTSSSSSILQRQQIVLLAHVTKAIIRHRAVTVSEDNVETMLMMQSVVGGVGSNRKDSFFNNSATFLGAASNGLGGLFSASAASSAVMGGLGGGGMPGSSSGKRPQQQQQRADNNANPFDVIVTDEGRDVTLPPFPSDSNKAIQLTSADSPSPCERPMVLPSSSASPQSRGDPNSAPASTAMVVEGAAAGNSDNVAVQQLQRRLLLRALLALRPTDQCICRVLDVRSGKVILRTPVADICSVANTDGNEGGGDEGATLQTAATEGRPSSSPTPEVGITWARCSSASFIINVNAVVAEMAAAAAAAAETASNTTTPFDKKTNDDDPPCFVIELRRCCRLGEESLLRLRAEGGGGDVAGEEGGGFDDSGLFNTANNTNQEGLLSSNNDAPRIQSAASKNINTPPTTTIATTTVALSAEQAADHYKSVLLSSCTLSRSDLETATTGMRPLALTVAMPTTTSLFSSSSSPLVSSVVSPAEGDEKKTSEEKACGVLYLSFLVSRTPLAAPPNPLMMMMAGAAAPPPSSRKGLAASSSSPSLSSSMTHPPLPPSSSRTASARRGGGAGGEGRVGPTFVRNDGGSNRSSGGSSSGHGHSQRPMSSSMGGGAAAKRIGSGFVRGNKPPTPPVKGPKTTTTTTPPSSSSSRSANRDAILHSGRSNNTNNKGMPMDADDDHECNVLTIETPTRRERDGNDNDNDNDDDANGNNVTLPGGEDSYYRTVPLREGAAGEGDEDEDDFLLANEDVTAFTYADTYARGGGLEDDDDDDDDGAGGGFGGGAMLMDGGSPTGGGGRYGPRKPSVFHVAGTMPVRIDAGEYANAALRLRAQQQRVASISAAHTAMGRIGGVGGNTNRDQNGGGRGGGVDMSFQSRLGTSASQYFAIDDDIRVDDGGQSISGGGGGPNSDDLSSASSSVNNTSSNAVLTTTPPPTGAVPLSRRPHTGLAVGYKFPSSASTNAPASSSPLGGGGTARSGAGALPPIPSSPLRQHQHQLQHITGGERGSVSSSSVIEQFSAETSNSSPIPISDVATPRSGGGGGGGVGATLQQFPSPGGGGGDSMPSSILLAPPPTRAALLLNSAPEAPLAPPPPPPSAAEALAMRRAVRATSIVASAAFVVSPSPQPAYVAAPSLTSANHLSANRNTKKDAHAMIETRRRGNSDADNDDDGMSNNSNDASEDDPLNATQPPNRREEGAESNDEGEEEGEPDRPPSVMEEEMLAMLPPPSPSPRRGDTDGGGEGGEKLNTGGGGVGVSGASNSNNNSSQSNKRPETLVVHIAGCEYLPAMMRKQSRSISGGSEGGNLLLQPSSSSSLMLPSSSLMLPSSSLMPPSARVRLLCEEEIVEQQFYPTTFAPPTSSATTATTGAASGWGQRIGISHFQRAGADTFRHSIVGGVGGVGGAPSAAIGSRSTVLVRTREVMCTAPSTEASVVVIGGEDGGRGKEVVKEKNEDAPTKDVSNTTTAPSPSSLFLPPIKAAVVGSGSKGDKDANGEGPPPPLFSERTAPPHLFDDDGGGAASSPLSPPSSSSSSSSNPTATTAQQQSLLLFSPSWPLAAAGWVRGLTSDNGSGSDANTFGGGGGGGISPRGESSTSHLALSSSNPLTSRNSPRPHEAIEGVGVGGGEMGSGGMLLTTNKKATVVRARALIFVVEDATTGERIGTAKVRVSEMLMEGEATARRIPLELTAHAAFSPSDAALLRSRSGRKRNVNGGGGKKNSSSNSNSVNTPTTPSSTSSSSRFPNKKKAKVEGSLSNNAFAATDAAAGADDQHHALAKTVALDTLSATTNTLDDNDENDDGNEDDGNDTEGEGDAFVPTIVISFAVMKATRVIPISRRQLGLPRSDSAVPTADRNPNNKNTAHSKEGKPITATDGGAAVALMPTRRPSPPPPPPPQQQQQQLPSSIDGKEGGGSGGEAMKRPHSSKSHCEDSVVGRSVKEEGGLEGNHRGGGGGDNQSSSASPSTSISSSLSSTTSRFAFMLFGVKRCDGLQFNNNNNNTALSEAEEACDGDPFVKVWAESRYYYRYSTATGPTQERAAAAQAALARDGGGASGGGGDADHNKNNATTTTSDENNLKMLLVRREDLVLQTAPQKHTASPEFAGGGGTFMGGSGTIGQGSRKRKKKKTHKRLRQWVGVVAFEVLDDDNEQVDTAAAAVKKPSASTALALTIPPPAPRLRIEVWDSTDDDWVDLLGLVRAPISAYLRSLFAVPLPFPAAVPPHHHHQQLLMPSTTIALCDGIIAKSNTRGRRSSSSGNNNNTDTNNSDNSTFKAVYETPVTTVVAPPHASSSSSPPSALPPSTFTSSTTPPSAAAAPRGTVSVEIGLVYEGIAYPLSSLEVGEAAAQKRALQPTEGLRAALGTNNTTPALVLPTSLQQHQPHPPLPPASSSSSSSPPPLIDGRVVREAAPPSSSSSSAMPSSIVEQQHAPTPRTPPPLVDSVDGANPLTAFAAATYPSNHHHHHQQHHASPLPNVKHQNDDTSLALTATIDTNPFSSTSRASKAPREDFSLPPMPMAGLQHDGGRGGKGNDSGGSGVVASAVHLPSAPLLPTSVSAINNPYHRPPPPPQQHQQQQQAAAAAAAQPGVVRVLPPATTATATATNSNTSSTSASNGITPPPPPIHIPSIGNGGNGVSGGVFGGLFASTTSSVHRPLPLAGGHHRHALLLGRAGGGGIGGGGGGLGMGILNAAAFGDANSPSLVLPAAMPSSSSTPSAAAASSSSIPRAQQQ